MYILKSRGMAHSNQVREFLITSRGVDLVDASVGPNGILVGSARLVHEAESRAATVRRQDESARRERALERQRKLVAAQIEALRSGLAVEEAEAASARAESERQVDVASLQRQQMRQSALGRSAGSRSVRRK
jgi:circadian clock protein KaiC